VANGLTLRVRLGLHAGWWAGGCFAVALAVLGGNHMDYLAAWHPLGHLGAMQARGATLWNVCGFVLPGLLLFAFALALEAAMQRDGAGRGGRIGTGLLMLSALAFAAQGLLPFDLDDPDALASQRHVSALVLALLGVMAGALWIAASLKSRRGWGVLVWGGAPLAGLLLLFLVWPPQEFVPMLQGRPGHAQRLIFATFFAWFALAAWVALRRGRSWPQTQPVA